MVRHFSLVCVKAKFEGDLNHCDDRMAEQCQRIVEFPLLKMSVLLMTLPSSRKIVVQLLSCINLPNRVSEQSVCCSF